MSTFEPSSTSIHKPRFYRQNNFWLAVLIVLIIVIFFRHCSFHKKTPPVAAIPVVTALAKSSDVPIYLSELGAVTPVYTVTVRTQINGQLLQVLYKEGQMVKQGDLLAEIDPRPYQAQLTQYEGQLKRDQALLDNANVDLKRYQTLWRQDSVAQQTLATQLALVKQYEGTVKLDEGLIQGVKVNLIYCQITSPVTGRVGLRLVDPGNFVQTTDTTGLAVIATLQPITVIFSIPEDNIPEVLEQISTGQALTVKAYDRQQNKLLSTGKLLTLDNQVDPTTGTVKLRAEFDNKDNKLFPNQFVNANLLVKILPKATVVPTAAVQHGAQNNFVYLLNKNDTVSMKPVIVGVAFGGNTVIKSGVLPGQFVVIQGVDRLTDGAKVIRSNKAPASPQKVTSNLKQRTLS
jgi:multidrug efflux system membrane fusion protein